MVSKRLDLVLLLAIMFSSSLVLAASCGFTHDNNLIMRISGSTNAHAEVYNGANGYGTEICYDTFFGRNYDPSPRNCIGTNTVLNLSASTNAHVQSPKNNFYNYATELCFADLVCSVTLDSTQSTGCSINGTGADDPRANVIARLSNYTNAHIETRTAGNYDWELCCKRVINMYWANDTSGTKIRGDTEARVGDTVYAFLPNWPAKTAGEGTQNEFRFTVYDEDGNGWGYNPGGSYPDQEVGKTNTMTGTNAHLRPSGGEDYYLPWTIYDGPPAGPTQRITHLGTTDGPGDTDPPVDMVFKLGSDGGIVKMAVLSEPLALSYCNDGDEQPDWEGCDDGPSNGVDGNGDICNVEYENFSCPYCDSNCQDAVNPMPKCGDGNLDDASVTKDIAEECDNGTLNLAIPPSGEGIIYCTAGTGPGKPPALGCRVAITPVSGEATWQDMTGNVITEASIGHKVKLVYKLPTPPPATLGAFDIWEHDGEVPITGTLIFPDERGADSDKIPDPLGIYLDTDSDGVNDTYYAIWEIKEEHVEAVRDTGEGDNVEFMFSIDQDNRSKNKLVVAVTPPAPGDPQPELELKLFEPPCGTIIDQGTERKIKFSIIDTDSAIKFNIKVNGAIINTTEDFSGGQEWSGGGLFETNYTFRQYGTANVRIEVENDATPQEKASIVSNIIVREFPLGPDRDYVAACIDEPENFEKIPESSAKFNASSTKVLRYGSGTDIDLLEIAPQNITFSWEFSDGATHAQTANVVGAQNFFKYFLSKGDNWAKLQIDVI